MSLSFERPRGMGPLFTVGKYDSPNGYEYERLRAGRKGPVYHAGQPVSIRPVWRGCDGAFRLGRTDDMVQMLADLGFETRAF